MNYEHEVVVPRAGMPFKIDIFEGAGGNYTREPHWHNSVEIFAIYEGSLVFILREKKIRVESGEFIIINTNELHSIRAEKANLAVYVQIPISEFKNYLTADHFISFHKKGKGAMADLDPAQMEENEKKMMTLIRNIYDLTGTDVPGHEYEMLRDYYDAVAGDRLSPGGGRRSFVPVFQGFAEIIADHGIYQKALCGGYFPTVFGGAIWLFHRTFIPYVPKIRPDQL